MEDREKPCNYRMITKDKDMAFIDAEELLFTEDAKNLIKILAKEIDEKNVVDLTKKICEILENQKRADVYVTLYNLLHSFVAKLNYTHGFERKT